MPEGHGYKKTYILDEWDFKSAGGCANFGMFERNPAYAINLNGAEESELQVRLRVISELTTDGSTL